MELEKDRYVVHEVASDLFEIIDTLTGKDIGESFEDEDEADDRCQELNNGDD